MHEPVRRVKFVVLGNYTSADLIQIVREKRDYLLIMYMPKLDCFPLSRVYFMLCFTGSAACLCAVAGVVRVSQQEVAVTF